MTTSPLIATFSIVATDGTDWGVAVASKFLGVGNAVPAAEAGLGALATQALANTSYRAAGLELLRAGRSAAEVVDQLTSQDEGREHRQLGVVDGQGRAANYTGKACLDWAGGVTGTNCSCQGNILTGPEVVESMRKEFEHSEGSLADRLMAALAAGDRSGGDRRGRQSAALLVARAGAGYAGFDDKMVDLRVDDHQRPVEELSRLLKIWRVHFEPSDPALLIPTDARILARIRRALEARGLLEPAASEEQLWQAFDRWAAVENLEERCHDHQRVDQVVLEALEAKASPA